MTRLAVLASHGGSLLQAVLDACEQGNLAARVVLVISNNSGSLALERARRAGLPVLHLSSSTHPDDERRDQAMMEALGECRADWVVLAGYMKKLGPLTLARFAQQIINVHPSLLPAYGGTGYYGRRVHEAVLTAGEKESGATVHLVSGDYDTGPILAQVRVPVRPTDTVEDLEQRVKNAEQKLIIEALCQLSRSSKAS